MSSEAFEQKHNDEACNYEKVKNKNVKAEKIPEQSGTIALPSTSKMANSNAHISIWNLTNDHDIERGAEFFDKCQQIMTDNNTKLFIFYISQFRAAYQKARCNIKKRTETRASTNPEELTLHEKCPNTELFLVLIWAFFTHC